MKRKSDEIAGDEAEKPSQVKPIKRQKSLSRKQEGFETNFRKDLFAEDILKKYTEDYVQSTPYKHAVIQKLMDDTLLRKVRDEVRENVHFTPKETDIYKIHQSGDLANLDGLDDAALKKLPSLLKLRDALYSPAFRKYVATITNAGELSGRKTDMAINVYTPGCHLLCHDDVIGSRRVSYILYLTDPDVAWQDEWGGALRLFPTSTFTTDDGEETKTPSPDYSKIIPPAWNQLSFFAVQPGVSFHDVEEVYNAENKEQLEKDGGRIRMAISGWFHIPQIGEDGYIEGAEEKLAAKSSLVQLQGKADRYDFPREEPTLVDASEKSSQESGLNEADIDFLLKYMAPTYLTPDTTQQIAEHFSEQSSVTIDGLLSKKFSARLKAYVEEQEALTLPERSVDIERGIWKVARPPHKHRFLYAQPSASSESSQDSGIDVSQSPFHELLDVFLPSRQFRLWLSIATECEIEDYSLIARRFRKGLDYALATSHEGKPRMEFTLGITPTTGWTVGGEDEEEVETKVDKKSKSKAKSNGEAAAAEEDDIGGHEVYMAGEEEDEEGDAAVYKSSGDAEDDNVLFTSPAAWNKLSIVLRDSGVLKFVKYVSKAAKGDRWDICGTYGVNMDDEDEDHVGAEANDTRHIPASQVTLESSEDEIFEGFLESEESDSD